MSGINFYGNPLGRMEMIMDWLHSPLESLAGSKVGDGGRVLMIRCSCFSEDNIRSLRKALIEVITYYLII
jgi:hypothetical protein